MIHNCVLSQENALFSSSLCSEDVFATLTLRRGGLSSTLSESRKYGLLSESKDDLVEGAVDLLLYQRAPRESGIVSKGMDEPRELTWLI